MNEIERRLRAAMIGATEPAPSGLLATIYQRHRRYRQRRRRAMVGGLAFAAAVAVAIPPIGHALGHGRHSVVPRSTGSARPGPPAATRLPPAAAPGTLLLTCDDANWGQLQSNWRAVSLKVGPIWFFAAREKGSGFVHFSNFRLPGRSLYRYRGFRGDVMIVEVADGATVVMKPVAAARSYFRFYDGFNGPTPNYLPAGDTGFTFAACPTAEGPNGPVTDFYLGYAIKSGRTAPVDIWTRPSSRPIQVIFTCPGC